MARVMVLKGGTSREREVSLKSGAAVAAALREMGHEVEELDVGEDFLERLPGMAGKVDAAFLVLHGRGGEDGTVQGALELARIPYTGSGVLASAAAMSKVMTKTIFRAEGIPVAADVVISRRDLDAQGLEMISQGIGRDLGFPCIVKPDREGSTVGVSVAHNLDELEKGLEEAFFLDELALVEEYVSGREFTVGILGKEQMVLPVLEVRSSRGIYDYHCKYTTGMTDYLVPAPLEEGTSGLLQELALRAHNALRCEGVSRIDFIVEEGGRVCCLEANTLPGMTELSLIPKAAAAAGIDFHGVIRMILESARLKTA
jgi:D-alanine-D-alanine ligase